MTTLPFDRRKNARKTGHWLNGRLGAGTLADVIAALLTDHGFTDFDVSAVSGDLPGYIQGGVEAARNLLEPLLEAFQVDVVEDGALLRFRSRGEAAMTARPIGVLAEREGEPAWRESRGHEGDFSSAVILTSYDPAQNYEQASVRSRRIDEGSNRVMRYDLPAVLPVETALAAAGSALRDHRAARRMVSFELPPNDIELQPGDCITLAGGPAGRFLVNRIDEGETRRVEAREFALSSASGTFAPDENRGASNNATDAFAPELLFMDLPRFTGGTGEDFACVAAMARPWRRIAIASSATSQGYAHRTVIDRPARMGALASDMPPGVSGRFDRAGSVDLDLYFGGLSSMEELAVLNGANLAAVRSASGAFEIFAFADAREVEPGRWRLSTFLRGLAGTEDAMLAGAQADAPVVILDRSVTPLGLASTERGLVLNWVAAAASGSERAGPFAFAGGTRAETPLAPVHVRARRLESGDIDISWIRRSRIDADDWEASEIPLDEQQERYRAEILKEGEPVRSVETQQSRYVYSAADALADFGTLPDTLEVRIRQTGRIVAAGIATQTSFPL